MDTSKATARPWEVLSTATKNPRTSEWREIRSGVAGVVRCDSFDVHRSGESYTECGVRISAADAALIVRAVNSHEALVAALRKVVSDLGELISQSHGVAGLHLNGDLASWGELTDGGRFEEWLSLDHARAALALAEQSGG